MTLLLMSSRALFSKCRETSGSQGLPSLFFLVSAELSMLPLDMIFILNAKATGWTCVCVHASNPRLLPAASEVIHLQRQFQIAKHPEASFFFLNFASYKEKVGVCVFLYKRACGGLIEALGFLDAACLQWRHQRIHTRQFPPVLSSPAPPGKK